MNEACYGISAEEIARRCRVNVATARRWKRGASQMPETAAMILADDLGVFDAAFTGWRIRDGQLISPEGWAASPRDVLSIPLLRAQVAAYQSEQRRVNSIEEQPAPGEALTTLADKAIRA